MEAVVERPESPQLRIVGAGDGSEAIWAGVEPLESRSGWGPLTTRARGRTLDRVWESILLAGP